MSQEFGNEVLDLVKQKGFYHYEHMCDFKKFNETLPSKNEFDGLIRGNGIRSKDYQMFAKFGISLKWGEWKTITICT